MNSAQVTAFLSAGGVDVASVRLLVISLVCAVSFLWVGKVVRDLGVHALNGSMHKMTMGIYLVRAVIVVILIIAVVS